MQMKMKMKNKNRYSGKAVQTVLHQIFFKVNVMPKGAGVFVFVCCAVFSLMVQQSIAQEIKADTTKKAQIEEVTIIGDYSPIVKEAFKIRTSPMVSTEEVRMPALSYSIKSSPVYHKASTKKLQAEKLGRPEAEEFRKNYLKLGFGNYTTPLIEFFANMEASSSNAFGVHLKHFSSSGDIDNYAPSAFSNNLLDVFGKKIWRKHMLTARAGFKRDVVHYYGFLPSDYGLIADDMDADTIMQNYMMFSAGLDFESTTKRRSDLKHAFSLDFYTLSDHYKTTENNIFFRADLNKDLKMFKFSRYQTLGLETKFWFYTNKIDTLDSETTIHLSAQPYFKAEWDEYRLKIGADIHYISDSSSNVSVFPRLEAAIQIIPGNLELYASYTGGLERNSFKSLIAENPYVSSYIQPGFTKTTYKINGGLAAKILPVLDLNVGGAYSSVENMAFFVTDTLSPFRNEFILQYDKVSVLHLYGEAVFKYQESMSLGASVHYRNYTMDNLAQAWHKPDLIAKLDVRYFPIPKLLLTAELIYMGKQYAPIYISGQEVALQLDGTLNLNIGAEYFIYDYFTVFLKGSNLLGDNYMRFLNYPTQALGVMGGLSFSF